jgi:hypothetical protein
MEDVMRKFLFLVSCVVCLSGCNTAMTGVMTGSITSITSRGAPLVLAYSDPEVILEQDKVVTLIVPNRYGLVVDGIPIKEMGGAFSPEVRVSKADDVGAYIVDLLPGTLKLTVTYDALKNQDGSAPGMSLITSHLRWARTSETTHALKGGEVYVIGLKTMAVSGTIDLYPVDEATRSSVIENRSRAQF